ncbi:MAG: hypothetical protein R2856_23660 [Caldilineaceae bacterium]
MSVGEVFAPEWTVFDDPISGVQVKQLTNYKGHSHHFYFTNPGWYAGGTKLLFGSDRANRANLYSIDLGSGEITQLTDLARYPRRLRRSSSSRVSTRRATRRISGTTAKSWRLI